MSEIKEFLFEIIEWSDEEQKERIRKLILDLESLERDRDRLNILEKQDKIDIHGYAIRIIADKLLEL